jgi:hypothetical protein
LSVQEKTASKFIPSTTGTIRLSTPAPLKVSASRAPRTSLIPVGVPPVSFLPLHETRRYSRTILVSQLSADEPFTVTSFFWEFQSSSVGVGLRPGATVNVGAAVGAAVAAVAAVAALLVVPVFAPVEGGVGVFFPMGSSCLPHPPLAASASAPAKAHPMILSSRIRRG